MFIIYRTLSSDLVFVSRSQGSIPSALANSSCVDGISGARCLRESDCDVADMTACNGSAIGWSLGCLCQLDTGACSCIGRPLAIGLGRLDHPKFRM